MVISPGWMGEYDFTAGCCVDVHLLVFIYMHPIFYMLDRSIGLAYPQRLGSYMDHPNCAANADMRRRLQTLPPPA